MDAGRHDLARFSRNLAILVTAWGAGSGCAAPPAPARPALSVSTGAIELLDDPTPRLGLEYRFRPQSRLRLGPDLGVSLSTDQMVYLYADLRREFWLDEHWVFAARAGFGGFFEDSSEIDLGDTLQFRTGFDLERRFDNGMRLGLSFFHLSNAGLSDRNPGTEELLVTWTLPLGAP